jgi:hypothetical protein
MTVGDEPVRQSISIDISAPATMSNAWCSASMTRSSSASERKVGVPPPKCSCETRWSLPSDSVTSLISVSSASRYSPAR